MTVDNDMALKEAYREEFGKLFAMLIEGLTPPINDTRHEPAQAVERFKNGFKLLQEAKAEVEKAIEAQP